LQDEGKIDSVTTAKFVINRDFTTHTLDYNLSSIRFARRGNPLYKRVTTLNGVEIPFVGNRTIRALRLSNKNIVAFSDANFSGESLLHIDTLSDSRTSMGFTFSSRNMPYAVTLATSQKLQRDWSLSTDIEARTGRDLHIEGLFGNALSISAVACKAFDKGNRLSIAIFARPSMRSTRQASTSEAFGLLGNNLYGERLCGVGLATYAYRCRADGEGTTL
jgi:hypothetical protein